VFLPSTRQQHGQRKFFHRDLALKGLNPHALQQSRPDGLPSKLPVRTFGGMSRLKELLTLLLGELLQVRGGAKMTPQRLLHILAIAALEVSSM
jgi:hypothetical protein